MNLLSNKLTMFFLLYRYWRK